MANKTNETIKTIPPLRGERGGSSRALRKPKVQRMGVCSYRIESVDIQPESEKEKRRGFIIETDGEALIVPFKKSDGRRRKPHDIRETEHGKLRLSAARQKVTLTITFDRDSDSEESFLEEFQKLTDGYVLDLLKYEVEECLE